MGLINRQVKNMNKMLLNKPASQALPNTKGILTLASFNDLLGSDEEDMQKFKWYPHFDLFEWSLRF